MYTQLTFFAGLAAYALWRALERPRSVAWWVAFVLSALAALYTHYFALFWLITLGLIALWPAWRRQSVLRLAISAAAVAAGYTAWLPAMLTRYRVDASYWQGALKLNEALRHVSIDWTTGAPETMLEGDAVRWLPWFGLALLAAAAGLLLTADRAQRRRRAGALLALVVAMVVPVGLALALASRNPKFNPRYLMMASPAYLLLLAGGAGAWWTARGRGRMAGQTLAVGIVALVLVASGSAARNWFSDPAFTKAQWRELAAFVKAHIGPNERVVLVSGHAAPAWDYYAADVPPVRLPNIDILDVNAVMGFEAAAPLGEALAGKDGAWLVSWQDEVVDPMGVTPYLLGRAGAEEQVPASFWKLGLRHWKLEPDATYPGEPVPQHAQGANFDHKLALLGWDAPKDGQLTVYWKALNALPADYQVSLIFEDAAGKELGRWDGRPAGYNYPATRWQVGRPVFGPYPVPVTAGAPGERYASLAIYSTDSPEGLDLRDEADNPAGKRVRLGPF
jgi:hypothetical protein